ncbi:helix-turn-helix domain-containing protein [Shigella boydii]
MQALGEELQDRDNRAVAARHDVGKSTVSRFLHTMKTLGYVAQEGECEKCS